MKSLKIALKTATLALAVGAWLPAVQGQTTTPSTYAYSVSITVGSPAGSATAAVAKDRPISVKALPCLSTTVDTLTFSLKYDAGKLLATPDGVVQSDSRQDVYVIFHKQGATDTFALLSRSGTGLAGAAPSITALTAVGATTSVTTASDLNANKAKTFWGKSTVASGSQTEVIFGSQIDLTGLDSGIWTATAIIAESTSTNTNFGVVNFDDPSTWRAWDSAPFLVRKPWKGDANTTCS